MRTKIWVVVMTLLALTYVLLLGGRAVALLGETSPIAVAMGAGMMLFPLVAVWAIWREIQFGFAAEALTRRALAENLPELELELRPSGRATKESAAIAFDQLKQDFDENDWTNWYLLSEAYEASGDRKRARASMRKALLLSNQPKSS